MGDEVGDRGVLVARELTKRYEELHRGTVKSTAAWFAETANIRGEFTIVLGPKEAVVLDEEDQLEQALARVRELVEGEGMSMSSAVKQSAKEVGVVKSKLYKLALNDGAADGG